MYHLCLRLVNINFVLLTFWLNYNSVELLADIVSHSTVTITIVFEP